MNLLFLSGHCCIRCVKEGLAMTEAGHSVVFMHQRVANPDMQTVIPLQTFWQSEPQLRQKLTIFSEIDLIHVHNEPSDLVWIAKEVRPELPVIFDVHDLDSVRHRRVFDNDVKAMDAADGVIFPSRGYSDYCHRELKYVFKDLADKASEVIYSMCTGQMLDMPEAVRTGGIIYQGRIRTDGGNKDYQQIIEALGRKGIPLYVMPTSQESAITYAQAGAMMMPTLPYLQMMRQLNRFDWGFSGPAVQCRDGDRGMPNKLFEYIAAGIPVIVHQADEAAGFVVENNLGVAIDDVSQIPEIYDQHVKYREIVRVKRAEFIMQTQVKKIEAVYHKAVEYHGTRKPYQAGERREPSALGHEQDADNEVLPACGS